MNKVADTWIVHLENLTDLIVLLLLYEIKIESLALTGRKLGKEPADIGMKEAVVLPADEQFLCAVVAPPHLIVVDGGVCAERAAPELIGEAIAEGDKKITADLAYLTSLALDKEFHEYIMDAIPDEFLVGSETHAIVQQRDGIHII